MEFIWLFLKFCGGIPLRGSVTVSGAKNAALPIICASIMAMNLAESKTCPI